MKEMITVLLASAFVISGSTTSKACTAQNPGSDVVTCSRCGQPVSPDQCVEIITITHTEPANCTA